jgi:hypothetical protein
MSKAKPMAARVRMSHLMSGETGGSGAGLREEATEKLLGIQRGGMLSET